jgi:FkbM family methyltransferase
MLTLSARPLVTRIQKFLKKIGFATHDDILRLHQIQMLSAASHYRLWNGDGRNASAKALDELFFGLVRITRPSVFIECGAKKAEASLRVRQLLPKAQIVAFEASPDNFKTYSESIDFNKHNIDYRHQAVSDHSGVVEFQIRHKIAGRKTGGNSGGNSILTRKDKISEYETHTVSCISLDTEFANAPSCALWIDVEGASKQVICGGLKTLSNASIVKIELEDYKCWKGQWTADVVSRKLYKLGLVPVARDFEYKGQYNIVWVNKQLIHNQVLRRNLEYFYSVLSFRHSGKALTDVHTP